MQESMLAVSNSHGRNQHSEVPDHEEEKDDDEEACSCWPNHEEEKDDDKFVDDEEACSCCYVCVGRFCGVLGFAMNLAIIAALGWGICRAQSFLSVADRESHDFGTANYVVVLAAGCPRCAWISPRAKRFDAQAVLFDDTHQTSPIVPLDNTTRTAGFWAMWMIAPSIQAAQYIFPAFQAYPVLTSGFITIMGLTLLQDFIYFLLALWHLCKGNICQALALLIAYILRNLALWAYAELYFFLYSSLYFQGANYALFVLTLTFIAAMRIASVCFGAVALCELCTSSDKELTVSLWTALCGTLVALPVCLCVGASMPFASGPLMFYIPFAFAIYAYIMYLGSHVPYICFIANVLVVEQLLDRGLANILLLDSLRHKTSLWRYLAIRVCGGLAASGGSEGGSTASIGMEDDTVGKFYVFKDTFFGECNDCTDAYVAMADGTGDLTSQLLGDPMQLVMPNIHAWLTARNAAAYFLSCTYYQDLFQDRNCCLAVLVALVSNAWGIVVIMLPSIKFRYTLQDLARQPFLNDPAYGGAAWFTYNNIPAWRIGPCGILCQTFLRFRSCHCLAADVRRGHARAGAKLLFGLFQLVVAALWVVAIDVWRNPLAVVILQWL